ncbi:HAD family hydrolase [Stackebrandtia nassauensis]|uniref:HAD-superfamily hydrolase, subfamily IIB n=1 Tax=Stackebrandtia nassauensis (strain DSM 44728 / CIP 108903 / NRRL B-16338 / NBRC 102104 / LLR-40K-21) TaxID=446470 RepID=D3Q2P1_STANL|nr:HAD family hydrolase [Stackebrandtia nassauensis]ADD45792.1 HAD-superfamily hydrolase, subfamily IIB [Stackebrandtia nassauensis DSM 44728]
MTPKLVVVDLDGTVVGYGNHRLAPSPTVVKALADVRAAGVPVAVATGRAIWDALPTIAALDLADGLVSTTHGAITYDLDAGRIVGRTPLDTVEAVRRFTEAEPKVAFAVERDEAGWYHTSNFNRDFESKWAEVVDRETLSAEPAVRLVARLSWVPYRHMAAPCPEADRLAATVGLDPALYQVEPGYNGWIDVGPAGVTKATGLAVIAEHYGVTAADTIVFGDAANDLPMFAWAGHSVALGQAHDVIKAAADEVAPSVTDDGVAHVLRRWFG